MHILSRVLYVALLLPVVGCTPATTGGAEGETLTPAAGDPFIIGLAGAPPDLFGPEEAPAFESAFISLSDSGFNTFFPLFLTGEVDGVATVSDHLSWFVSPQMLGQTARSCADTDNPYAAAEGLLDLLFPGFLLVEGQDTTQPIDTDVFGEGLAEVASTCWGDHPGVVSAVQTFDEPILFHTVASYTGEAQLDLDNIGAVNQEVADRLDLPSVVIEGPFPFAIRDIELPDQVREDLVEQFWANTQAIETDWFGFDVYPVPDASLATVGEYVRYTRSFQPDAVPLSVLQGFGLEFMTGGASAGRPPTLEESRFVAFDSVAAGANGVLWWGQSAIDLGDAEQATLWADLSTVAAELASVQTLLESGEFEVESQWPDVGLRAYSMAEGQGFVVTNRTEDERTVTLDRPDGLASVEVQVGPAAPAIDGDQVSLTLPAHGVSVFELTP